MLLVLRAAEIAGVIALWFLALRMWNVGSHSPVRAARGLLTEPTPLRALAALSRLLAGCILAVLALGMLLAVAEPAALGDFSALAIATALTALSAEYLLKA